MLWKLIQAPFSSKINFPVSVCDWWWYGMQIDKIDIVTAAMGHALATEGGFCTGSARVIDHQVCK